MVSAARTAALKIIALAVISAMCALSPHQRSHAQPAAEKRELTPADAVATVRVIENQLTLGERVDSGEVSPDGKRYLLRVIHGDVQRNGVWMDLRTGRLDGSLEVAADAKPCARLFTTGLGSAKTAESADSDPNSTNILQWINNTQVAFLWSDPNAVRQVMWLDVVSCKHRFVTHSATNVFSFGFARDGSLLFDAQIPRVPGSSHLLWQRGFAIHPASDGWSILRGEVDGVSADSYMDNVWFIRSGSKDRPIDIIGNRIDLTNPSYRDLFLSPDGQLALIDIGIPSLPAGWQRYSSPSLQSLIKSDQSNPGRLPFRYAILDLKSGRSRLLWDSPRAFRGQIAWSPDSHTLILAPTFLPLDADSPLGSSGAAAAELDVRSGQYRTLPIDLTARTVVSTEWLTPAMVEIHSTNDLGADHRVDRLMRETSAWKVVPATDSAAPRRHSVHLETRQSLNSPPQVFAVESPSGGSRLVLDPNPDLLNHFKLGHVERISGVLSNGKQWIGQLIYPAEYRPGTRYPLVIQSEYGHVFRQEEFALDGGWSAPGMGLGPSLFSSDPGQLLATHNIAVLTLSVMHFSHGSAQDDEYQLAYESVAKQLVASGLVDPNKIGLIGFSRNGHWVEFTLAHSTFPFAAAIAADNYDPSYFQSALANWRNEDVQMNGGPAFGDTLQNWIGRAVGFNAEHIHTPLLMINQSDGLLMIMAKWEIFSRLRYLKKPVEMYMMPEADTHPSHLPQNPRQIIAIQERAVDWLTFWLTGREDPSPSKIEQYNRWRAFRQSSASAVPNP
jgi:hypothetical protein